MDSQSVLALGVKAPVDVIEKRYDVPAREFLQSDSGGGTRYRTEAGSLRLPLYVELTLRQGPFMPGDSVIPEEHQITL